MARISLELKYKAKMVLAQKRGDIEEYIKFRLKLEKIRISN